MQLVQRAALFLVVIVATAGNVQAGMITLSATDSGWYRDDGFHQSTNENYIAGTEHSIHRNFFTFDLSSVSGTIVGATLRLENPNNGYYYFPPGPDPSPSYALFDVTTPVATLTAAHSAGPAGVAVYDDLGTGASYGSVSVNSSSNGTIVEISLGASAISDLNAAIGADFAIGGALPPSTGFNYIFGSTSPGAFTKELTLETSSVSPVPEPSSLALFSIGTAMTGLGAARRRRREKQQPSEDSPQEA
ncbi:PEP-CTERM motif protein [Maioricimonas rarisocia]|uniref:PEP-CTERM motif protein n=1 Tax=Maioricimonas rarisocia TaxID=2528026 RepID=A0A517ZG79_9PLAN|nr:PEP-CTERM sorting domain-containing protein [Maioricimonas rarisocia]QDU41480.1 PEP-CTERM motif protein [Maioricimonas rarisocia]